MNVVKPSGNPFYFKLAMVLVSLICLGYLSVVGKEILSPLLFSLLFAILLLPLAIFFEKRFKFPRGAASGLSVILFLAAISGLLYIVGTQISGLAQDWPMFQKQLILSFNNLREWVSSTFHVKMDAPMHYVSTYASKWVSYSTTNPWYNGDHYIFGNAVSCLHHDRYLLPVVIPEVDHEIFSRRF